MILFIYIKGMKIFIKEQFEKFGIRLNFVKNLWYLDSFYLLKKLNANQSPIIFDVGGCDGVAVIDFKKMFPQSFIFSFEPYPASFNNLVKSSQQYSGVKYYELALSNMDGMMIFFGNRKKATNSLLRPKITNSFIDEHAIFEGESQVECKMLDTFLADNNLLEIDILKIDVQGEELMVLEGAKKVLQEKKVKLIYLEVWFTEAYYGQPLYHDIANYLAGYGYFSYGIYNMHYKKDGHFLWGDAIFYLKIV